MGEIVLEEEEEIDLSPYWAFFSAQSVYDGQIHIAIEWKYIQLTPEEYERRVSARAGARLVCMGRDVGAWVKGLFGQGSGDLWV